MADAGRGAGGPERGDRRDRRRGDRRGNEARPTAAPDDSVLDALGVGGDGSAGAREAGEQAEPSGFVPGWGETSQPADSRFLSRQAKRIVSAGSSTFERLYRIFIGARAALGVALLLTQILACALWPRQRTGGRYGPDSRRQWRRRHRRNPVCRRRRPHGNRHRRNR